jgi:hypothetical protein
VKAKRMGRPPLPKGEARDDVFTIRVNAKNASRSKPLRGGPVFLRRFGRGRF